MNQFDCPSRDLLACFTSGQLDEPSAIQVGAHLDDCPRCRALMETIGDANDTLAAALRRPIPHDGYEQESALQRAASLIQAIGREPSVASGQAASTGEDLEVADLGVLGQYQLLAKLGEGGMGAVYKALHTRLKRLVALKVLPPGRMSNQQAVDRFRREMEAVGKLDHPNIVRATDAGEWGDTHYLVMELVDGIDMSQLVRKVGPLRVADACELVRQAATGLQHAHQRGMVHRDIKPSNVMLTVTEDGHAQVKILDMGLALLAAHTAAREQQLTSTGQMMGTLDYMAPEQGGDSHQVDIRADIYSLGATLYKVLTGESPFPASQYNTPLKLLTALATVPAPSVAGKRSDLPPELVGIVDRMLAMNPRDRFATPADVAQALSAHVAGADLPALLATARFGQACVPKGNLSGDTMELSTSASQETAPGMQQPCAIEPTITLPSSASAATSGDTASSNAAATMAAAGPSSTNTSLRPAVSHGSGVWSRIGTIAVGLGGIILLGLVTLYFQTNKGTIIVELDDPEGLIQVSVVGEDIIISDQQQAGEPIKLRPGVHKLQVTRGALEFETDEFSLKRGERVAVVVRVASGEIRVVQDQSDHPTLAARPLDAFPQQSGASATASSPSNFIQPAQPNFALQFDGQSSYVEIPDLEYESDQPITIEAHVRVFPTSFRWGAVVSNSTARGFAGRVALYHYKPNKAMGTWSFSAYGMKNGNAAVSSSRDQGILVHVAGVWDGSRSRLFINGEQAEENTSIQDETNQRPSVPKPFHIGASADGVYESKPEGFFCGVIDEVRISKIARYTANFQPLWPGQRFKADEHTLALYHLDEGEGEVAHDTSGNKRHGRISGADWVNIAPDSQSLAEPNRRAAMWLLAQGNAVSFVWRGEGRHFDRIEKLPLEPFTIESLALLQRIPDPTELVPLLGSLTGLKYVHARSPAIDDQFLVQAALQELPRVVTLHMDGPIPSRDGVRITDKGVVALASMTQLTDLGLQNTPITDGSVGSITQLRNLKRLNLQATNLTSQGVKFLPNLQRLEFLNVSEISLGDDAVVDFHRFTQLKELLIAGTNVTDAGLSHVARIPDLRKLAADRTKITDRGLAELAKLRDLAYLDITRTSVTAAGVANLKRVMPACEIVSSFSAEQIAGALTETVPPTPNDDRPLADAAAAMPALGEMAVVSRPEPIPGLKGWTIETRGQRGRTTSVAYSPDGHWLAWGDEQGTIRLWDRKADRLASIFVGNAGQVVDLDFAPQSHLLASRNLLAEICVWEIPTGQLIRRCAGRNPRFSGDFCEWSSDGKTLATVDPEHYSHVIFYDVHEGKQHDTIPLNEEVLGLAWSSRTGLLAVALHKRIDVFENVDDAWRKVETVVDDVATSVAGLEWSHDGRRLAWLVRYESWGLWDRESRASAQPVKVAGCGDANILRWSPDDKRIAVGAADHVAIYDTLEGRELQRLRGNQQTYYYAMDWSPEGRMLTAGEGFLYDFDAESGTEQRMYAGRPHGYTHGNVSAVSWTSDAQAIYCGNGHSDARRWTPQDEDPVWNLDSPPAEDPLRYGMLALSPDEQQLAVGSQFSTPIKILETRSLKTRLTIDAPQERRQLAWSPDGRMLATVTPGTIDVWDARDGRRLGSLGDLPANGPRMVAWGPGSTTLAVPGNDLSHVRLWRLGSDDEIQRLNLESPYITTIRFAADGKRLAVGTLRNGIELFETDPPRRTKKLSGNLSSVQDLHWTPEGRLWSVHGVPTAKCELVCWDTERGVPIRRTPLPPELGLAVFSPGGDRVATVTDSGQVQLFETTTGQPLGTFIPFEWGGNLVVSPAGHYWATPELQDELVYVVHSDTGQRMLTPDEFATQYGWQNDPHRVHGFEPMAVPR